LTRSSTYPFCATPSAAVGSSRMTMREFPHGGAGDGDRLALPAGSRATPYLGLYQEAERWRQWAMERQLLLVEDAAQAWLSERKRTSDSVGGRDRHLLPLQNARPLGRRCHRLDSSTHSPDGCYQPGARKSRVGSQAPTPAAVGRRRRYRPLEVCAVRPRVRHVRRRGPDKCAVARSRLRHPARGRSRHCCTTTCELRNASRRASRPRGTFVLGVPPGSISATAFPIEVGREVCSPRAAGGCRS
jgi:hypothetical protein